MPLLATAFIGVVPQLNPAAFVAAGQKAGAAAGAGAGGTFAGGFNKGTKGLFKNMASQFASTANLLVPVGIVAAVAKIGQIGMAYEDNLNIFRVVTKATGQQMDQVAQKARQLGADITLPGVSAAGAAAAMTELSKAGFTVQQSMDAARATLQLARISEISEADAAVIAANAVNAFGIAAKDTTFVVDELASAANSSSVDIHDVELAFRQASAVFSGFQGPVVGSKEAITELNTAIAILGNNGIRGSDAGTSLKQMLLQLTGPTERAKVVMEELALRAAGANISLEQQVAIIQGSKKVRDLTLKSIKDGNKAIGDQGDIAYTASGQMRPLTEVIDLVTRGTKGMTQEQRNAAITQIFGADATRSVIALMKGGLPVYDAMRKAVLRQGAAAEVAAAKNAGLRGSLDNIRSQLENIAIELYNQVKGPLRDAFNSLALSLQGLPDKIRVVGDFVRENAGTFKLFAGVILTVAKAMLAYRAAILLSLAATKAFLVAQSVIAFVQLAVQVRSLGAAWALLGVSIGKSNTKVAAATANLEKMGPSGEKAARGLNRAATESAKAALALGALAAAGAAFDHLAQDSTNVDRLTESIQELARTGRVTGELTSTFGDNLDDLGINASFANSKYLDFVEGVADSIPIAGAAGKSFGNLISRIAFGTDMNQAKERFASLDQSLSTFIQTTGDAEQAGRIWNQVLLKSGLDTEQLAKLLPNAWHGLVELQAQAHKVVPALSAAAAHQAQMKEQTKQAAGAAKGQVDSLKALNDSLRAMYDPTFAFISAEKTLKDAQHAATDAIKKNGKSSKEAKAATLELAGATLDLHEKASQMSKGFDGSLTPAMKKVLKAAGVTDTEIGILAKSFQKAKDDADKFDGTYEAKSSAPGAKEADKQLKNAYKRATDFDGSYKAFMSTPNGKQSEVQINKAWAALKGYDGDWVAHISTSNYKPVADDLRHLMAAQQALKDNTSFNEANRELGHFFIAKARGGEVPGYSPNSTADNIPAWLTAGEYVHPVSAVQYYGHDLMSAIQHRRLPREDLQAIAAFSKGGRVGYASGGATNMPYPVDVKKTKIPEVALPGPGDGATWKWIVSAAHKGVPGIGVISTFRRGATTLSGRPSYHASGRAVDFKDGAIGKRLAQYWNLHYKKITRELISPWNSLNIHNGGRHAYTGAIYRQHSGGNAHVHIAVAKGGLIRPDGKGLPVKSFDQGGSWASGTIGVNRSGHTEQVLTGGPNGEMATLRRALDAMVAELQEIRRSVNRVPEGVGQHVNRAVRSVDPAIGASANLYARSSW